MYKLKCVYIDIFIYIVAYMSISFCWQMRIYEHIFFSFNTWSGVVSKLSTCCLAAEQELINVAKKVKTPSLVGTHRWVSQVDDWIPQFFGTKKMPGMLQDP